jgi:O-antigen ligase
MQRPSFDSVLFAGLLLFGATLALSKSAGNVLLFLLYAALAVRALYDREFRGRIARCGRQPLTLAFAGMSAVAFAGIWYSENRTEGLQIALKYLSLPAIYYLTAVLLQSRRDQRERTRHAENLLFSFLAGLLALNALGVLTFIGLVGDRAFVVPLAPLRLHHIWYSNINALGFYAAAALVLYCPRCQSVRARVYLSLYLLLCALCILFSLSRTAWFSLLLTLMVLAVFVVRSRKVIVAAGAVALLVGALAYAAVPLVHDRLDLIASEIEQFSAGEQFSSIGNRLLMWKAALMMFASQPLLGVGTGDYVPVMSGYIGSGQFPESLREYNQPHNMYLFSLATNGVFGVAALLALLVASLRRALPLLRAGGSERLFGFLGLAAAVHFMGAGMTDSIFAIQILRFAFAFVIGVCIRGAAADA